VEAFLAGQRFCFSLAIEMQGSRFQLLVWRELLAIPYGQTASYGDIAKRIGSPGASRAVGSANRCNPLLIVVPCHRVISATGSLCGYSGGQEQKRFLLSLEEKHAAACMAL
jgi:methylated-DNA-[protein]-cysteine S-methyltransferase